MTADGGLRVSPVVFFLGAAVVFLVAAGFFGAASLALGGGLEGSTPLGLAGRMSVRAHTHTHTRTHAHTHTHTYINSWNKKCLALVSCVPVSIDVSMVVCALCSAGHIYVSMVCVCAVLGILM